MSSVQPSVDAAGRRRSPATMPAFRAGKAPRNKGQRYPADPPRVDEIVAVMRAAGQARYGARLNGLIVVLWRAGLRIHEALSLLESDLDQRRGSILVRHGKNDRRREVGMDAWAWSALEPWLAERAKLPVGPMFCVIVGPTRGHRWSECAGSARAAPDSDRGRGAQTLRASSVEACSCCRAAARRHPTPADPAPAGAQPSVHHGHLPPGNLL
jgi:integrase